MAPRVSADEARQRYEALVRTPSKIPSPLPSPKKPTSPPISPPIISRPIPSAAQERAPARPRALSSAGRRKSVVLGLTTVCLAALMHLGTNEQLLTAAVPACEAPPKVGNGKKRPDPKGQPACEAHSQASPVAHALSASVVQLPWLRSAPGWVRVLLEQLSLREALLYLIGVVVLAIVRREAVRAHRRALAAGGPRVLNMAALNDVNAFKEIFWAYLNASLLEPLLSIADSDGDDPAVATHKLVVNLFQLVGIGSWLYFVYDAFDTSDVQQGFTYRKMRLAGETAPWLRAEAAALGHHDHHQAAGSLRRDACLWLMLSGIFAAQAGLVTHREGIHAYATTALWCVLHHQSRAATSWGAGYFCTLLMPSAALMPLEYCLLLTDDGKVEDLESLAEWREYIRGETGVDLIIEHPAS